MHIKSGKTHDNDAGKIVIEGGSAVGDGGGAISMKLVILKVVMAVQFYCKQALVAK